MAGEVQRQLDATRQELRRGVFELPEETAEAASAMRRVVADQIEALKELTAVVTAPGRISTSPSRAAAGLRLAPKRRATARHRRSPRSPRDDDGPTAHRGAGAAEPARPAAQRPRARARAASARRRAADAPPAPNATSQDGCRTFSPPPRATRRRPRRPRRRTSAPEGISLDVAKFVDTEAAAEMWDRWRGGDTDARSAAASTRRGPADVRRNPPPLPLRSAVPGAVTRYTQEFERLLAKIGQSDRDGAQSRATLLSDAGKVYTMLAHASGRLG